MIYKTYSRFAKTILLCTAWVLMLSACSPRAEPSPIISTAPPPTAAFTAIPTTPAPPPATPTPAPSPTPQGLVPPIRAAFYYPYTAQDWLVDTDTPRSRFSPPSGLYTASNQIVVETHIRQMQYGGIQAAILTGRGSSVDRLNLLQVLMDAAQSPGFYWSLELTPFSDDPAPDPASLLNTLYKGLAARQGYLKISGKPVLFIRLDGDICTFAQAWIIASQSRFFLSVSAGEGYNGCPVQPDSWYPILQPDESSAATPDAAVIRPGYWPVDAPIGQFRSLQSWIADVHQYFTPAYTFHLVDSFNKWSDGTAIEPAREWALGSEMGAYLNALSPGYAADDGGETAVIAGAGDISVCDWPFDDRVSDLFKLIPGDIFTLGDNSNEQGSWEQYQRCFADSWGRFKERIHPVPGNHDYVNPGANAYFEYYGAQAGEPGKGYYSYDLGAWHLIALNGNCSAVGGCWAGSPQETWLREDLKSHPTACTLAYWHQPRWSSGIHGGDDTYDAFWRVLYEYGAELVMNGHDHHYERFSPQTPDGVLDWEHGIRQFIAGTGGAGTRRTGDPLPNSEVLHTGTDGVLALSLYPDRYEWQFIPTGADAFSDWGTTPCH